MKKSNRSSVDHREQPVDQLRDIMMDAPGENQRGVCIPAPKSLCTAYLWWIPPIGLLGAHQYYLRRWKWGLLYTFTMSWFGIGWVMDMFRMNKLLKNYHSSYKNHDSVSNVPHSWDAYLLWMPPFGCIGFHRYAAGHIKTGLLYTCTFGVFGLGWLSDVFFLRQLYEGKACTLSSLQVYALWITPFGLLGAHHYALGRRKWGLVYTFTMGMLGIGWLSDAFRIPMLVTEYNFMKSREEEQLKCDAKKTGAKSRARLEASIIGPLLQDGEDDARPSRTKVAKYQQQQYKSGWKVVGSAGPSSVMSDTDDCESETTATGTLWTEVSTTFDEGSSEDEDLLGDATQNIRQQQDDEEFTQVMSPPKPRFRQEKYRHYFDGGKRLSNITEENLQKLNERESKKNQASNPNIAFPMFQRTYSEPYVIILEVLTWRGLWSAMFLIFTSMVAAALCTGLLRNYSTPETFSVMRLVVCAVMFFYGIKYVIAIDRDNNRKASAMLKDERCNVIMMFIAVFIYCNPTAYALMTSYGPDSMIYRACVAIIGDVSTGMMLFYSLHLLEVINLGPTKRRVCCSWFGKMTLVLFFYGGCFVENLSGILGMSSEAARAHEDALLTVYYVGVSVQIAIVLLWGIWYLSLLGETCDVVRARPATKYRYQHLILHFVVIQTVSLFVYAFVLGIVSAVLEENYVYRLWMLTDLNTDFSNTEYFDDDAKFLLFAVNATVHLFIWTPANMTKKETEVLYQKHSSFSIDVAVWLFQFALQAYHDYTGKKGHTQMDVSWMDWEILDVVFNSRYDTLAFVAKKGPNVVVSFRGSKGFNNYLTDVSVMTREIKEIAASIPVDGVKRTGQEYCHSGFFAAYKSLREKLFASIKSAQGDDFGSGTLFITGHSLGGALATLLSADMAAMNTPVVCYTFGSPRVGNHAFAKFYDALVPNTYRVVFDGDFVAGVPKFVNMYKHVGSEVLIDFAGNVVIAPSYIESRFFKSMSTSFLKHARVTYSAGLRTCLTSHAPIAVAKQRDLHQPGSRPPTPLATHAIDIRLHEDEGKENGEDDTEQEVVKGTDAVAV
eukprot:GFYU01004904.1.p1 GENE.GFYU01004904.1~~GFYU01004904.1.p1  ORF type:complete len:1060 (-),score=260.03 GFYU01004904.1:302-3481(-)